MEYQNLEEELYDHPQVQRIINSVQSRLEKEKEARRKFYDWMTPERKAEFINGEIIIHSPARRGHVKATDHIVSLLLAHVIENDLGWAGAEKNMVQLERNDFEPDGAYWRKEIADTFDDDTVLYPAPDLVIEVLSKGTEERDRGVKFNDYERAGVTEYWLVNYREKYIEQHQLVDGRYRLVTVNKYRDRIKSVVVPGFEIPVAAAFDSQVYIREIRRGSRTIE